jgi:hypothetical protein
MNSREKKTVRKPYQTPVLHVYGDIRKLTKNVGSTGMNDAKSSSATKTGA